MGTLLVFLAIQAGSSFLALEVADGGGDLSIPSSHPRLWFYDGAGDRMAQALTWWGSNSYTPSASDGYGNAFRYLMTGNATALTNVVNFLFSETSGSLGWFMEWAYQGTFPSGDTTPGDFVPIGAVAAEASSVATDTYRGADHIVPMFDWCYDGLSSTQRDKFMNGWTTTWPVAGAHFGETVSIPGYKALSNNFRQKAWGGITMPFSNYFHGYFRNELLYMLAAWHEDTSYCQDTLQPWLLGATGSRLSVLAAYAPMANGWSPEGSHYGRYHFAYLSLPFLSLKEMGRNLFEEVPFYKAGVTRLARLLSHQALSPQEGVTPYFQIFPYNDAQFDGGYPRVALEFSPKYYGNYLQAMAQAYPGVAAVEGYGRRILSVASVDADKWIQSTDPGGSTSDWTAALTLDVYDSDAKVIVTKGSWASTAATVYFSGVRGDSGHAHKDPGSWQAYRGDRWICKEMTQYAVRAAGMRLVGTVAASPSPTTTQFAGTNLPTTDSWFNGYECRFLTGALAGVTKSVSAFVGSTGRLTTAAFASAPSAGDKFVLYDPAGVGVSDMDCHAGVMIANTGVNGPDTNFRAGVGVINFFTTHADYTYWQSDVTNEYKGNPSNIGGFPQRDNPYVASLVREFVFLRALECLVILDRVGTQTVSGNGYWPSWTGTKVPSASLVFSPASWTTGSTTASSAGGTHTQKVFVLLPTSPTITTTYMKDYTGSYYDDGWYQYRLEVGDYTEPGTTRYCLCVVQFKDTSDSDVSASISAETGSDWTISISHATKGSATIVFNKGLTASAGTVSVSP